MQKNNRYSNSYLVFKRFEHEILIDVNENLESSDNLVIKDTVFSIGVNEIHHLVKYYQKIILNSLFFKDQKILIEYNIWLYRVYYNRNIDLEFFYYLNKLFQKVSSKYINYKYFIPIDELFELILKQHKEYKEKAVKTAIYIEYEEEASLFAEYLISNNKAAILEQFCKKVTTIEGFISFYDTIVFNGMKKIGLLWEQGKVSIAQEHVATNLLDNVLINLLESFEVQECKNKHIFFSSAPNELHGLAVKIASLLCEKLGFKVTSLGVNIPAKEIKKAIREFQPDYILFSATLQSSIIDVALLIDELEQEKESFMNNFKIGIAGNGFEKLIQPAKTLKANFYIKELKDLEAFNIIQIA